MLDRPLECGVTGLCYGENVALVSELHRQAVRDEYERTATCMAKKTRQSDTGTDDPYGSRPDSPFLLLKSKRQARTSSWGDVDPELIARVAERVTESGCLFSLSKTSDGGALHLFVKNGPDVIEGYYPRAEDAAEALTELYDAFA